MRAVLLRAPGGPEQLAVETVDDPVPGPGEALVRVQAAALTRDELEWPVDRLPAIPSYELSGTVEAVGEGVRDLAPGDDVFALTAFDRDGVAAELAAVPAGLLAPRPASLDHVTAAALPLAGLSAWQGLFDHGGLERGERVRITGARGGVGHLAAQLARWAGAEVVEGPGPEPVDLLFDCSGRESLAGSQAARVVSVAEEPPAPGVYYLVQPKRDQLVRLAELADEGSLRPEIDSVFPLADARAAFERLAQRGKHGKVVLRVGD